MELIAAGQPGLLQNCRIVVDQTRIDYDGWLSVIGQRGKSVTVVDYFVTMRQGDAQVQENEGSTK